MGTWSRELKQRHDGTGLLACLPHPAQGTFLDCPGLPAQRWHHPHGLGSPTSIINEENAPKELPTGQPDGDIFSIEAPSSQMILAYVKLTKTTTTTNEPAQPH